MSITPRTMLQHALSFVVIPLLACGVLACDAAPQDTTDAPVLSFDVARIRLIAGADTNYLHVELAKSSPQQTLGLMERGHLPDTSGMLFLYQFTQPATAGFWMFRTKVPLDIAYVDSMGAIVAIKQMVPCTSTLAEGCPSYPPEVPYRAALEAGAGYFASHKLTLGSRVMLGDTSVVVTRAPK
ncbi:MAG: DUF192 domain-containing protein [bacterium]